MKNQTENTNISVFSMVRITRGRAESSPPGITGCRRASPGGVFLGLLFFVFLATFGATFEYFNLDRKRVI